MSKKKAKKAKKAKLSDNYELTQKVIETKPVLVTDKIESGLALLERRAEQIEQRIDRIVDALGKSKPVRGL